MGYPVEDVIPGTVYRFGSGGFTAGASGPSRNSQTNGIFSQDYYLQQAIAEEFNADACRARKDNPGSFRGQLAGQRLPVPREGHLAGGFVLRPRSAA